jgi:tetratricopeptide (TPR) repeat protein
MNERPDPFSDALACHRAGRYREAETLLVESLARQPRQPDTWNLMGATLAGLRRYPEAENAYRRALALQPNHLGALNNLAVLLRQTGRAEEARRTYLETLRYEPRHVDAWNNLAALHATRQDYAQALACYRKVLQLQPDYGHALGAAANAMAMLWEWSGRTSICQRLADGIRAGASVTVPFVVLSYLDEPELQLAGARA